MPTIYIETSTVSYLRRNPAAAADSVRRQLLTERWWDWHRERYDLVTSQYVLDEAATGNEPLAAERLNHLAGIPLLPLSDQIDVVAAEIVQRAILPNDALVDALHIACSAVNAVDILLTWNCKHLANPLILPRVFRVLSDYGLTIPVICTPEDLLDEDEDETED
jgi:predicted nucleic acid-binding protein